LHQDIKYFNHLNIQTHTTIVIMSRGININDAQELLKRKLLINKMSLECLTHQIEFSKQSSILQVLTMQDATKKHALVIELNVIIEKQLSEFTELRQVACVEIYRQINQIDTPTARFREIIGKLDNAQESMCNLMNNIRYLELQIPDQQLITNFHIIPKECPSTAHNCATDAMVFGVDQHPDTL
jgi:hypothetical protein